eukprot:scaffold143604_cov40-Prasinocladus_malaysianus.AAC.1
MCNTAKLLCSPQRRDCVCGNDEVSSYCQRGAGPQASRGERAAGGAGARPGEGGARGLRAR